MFTRLILLTSLTLVFGCAGSNVSSPPEGIAQDELGPTLDQIAETGQFEEEMLSELTAGLEKAGLVGEAATAQQLPSLTNERQIKQLAKRLSAAVKKQLASDDQ
jgi:hypothetical protein